MRLLFTGEIVGRTRGETGVPPLPHLRLARGIKTWTFLNRDRRLDAWAATRRRAASSSGPRITNGAHPFVSRIAATLRRRDAFDGKWKHVSRRPSLV